MQYLLSRASCALLKQLAQEKILCAFDFDGTLSPIVEDPDQASMSDRTRDLLARLARLYPCIIISGRARADVLGKMNGVPVADVIGNHGAETGPDTQGWRSPVAQWKQALERALPGIPGIRIEDKGLSLAVHYRLAAPGSQARRRIMEAARGLNGVRVFGGKRVVNLVVDGAPDKGTALAAARHRFDCDWVLYVGDDENDEDAFALDGNVVPVRIGRPRQSHARYYLRAQAEVDRLLEQLIVLREANRLNGEQP
jgi:trehalose 6-phosphate phosphatase